MHTTVSTRCVYGGKHSGRAGGGGGGGGRRKRETGGGGGGGGMLQYTQGHNDKVWCMNNCTGLARTPQRDVWSIQCRLGGSNTNTRKDRKFLERRGKATSIKCPTHRCWFLCQKINRENNSVWPLTDLYPAALTAKKKKKKKKLFVLDTSSA